MRDSVAKIVKREINLAMRVLLWFLPREPFVDLFRAALERRRTNAWPVDRNRRRIRRGDTLLLLGRAWQPHFPKRQENHRRVANPKAEPSGDQ